jgi:predicted ATPase
MIKSINIPLSETQQMGLAHIDMKNIGKFVVFSGKNGSGKSRVLSLIDSLLTVYKNNCNSIDDLYESIDYLSEQLRMREEVDFLNTTPLQNEIEDKKRILSIINNYFEINENNPEILHFVPKSGPLTSHRDVNDKQYEYLIQKLRAEPLVNYNAISLAYIDRLFKKFNTYSNGYIDATESKCQEVKDEFNRLLTIFEKIMNTKIILTGENLNIFESDIDTANLSDGQRVCMQIVVALHFQSSKLDGLTLFLDEPENHLHPSAVIDFITELEAIAPEAQFFIATHSVPLISYIHAKDQNSLWFVENGSVKRAGRTPEHVLKSLLGDQDRINELRSFTELPEILAQINYAVQCLMPPGVVGSTTGDAQNNQIYRVLSNLENRERLRLLDYGAGRGRILDGLAELAEKASKKPEDKFDYFAFDAHPNHARECKAVIARYYDNPDARYANNMIDYIQSTKSLIGSFDIVLLCNVLHEISPDKWVNLFKKGAPIDRLLSDNGYLLIVEDNRIPVGEKAHDFGFIVPDRAELQLLFNIPPNVADDFVSDDARAGRGLKAHLIHKKYLENITSLTVKEAIRSVKYTAEAQVNKIRHSGLKDYKHGLEYAYWVHQYTNSSLYLGL